MDYFAPRAANTFHIGEDGGDFDTPAYCTTVDGFFDPPTDDITVIAIGERTSLASWWMLSSYLVLFALTPFCLY